GPRLLGQNRSPDAARNWPPIRVPRQLPHTRRAELVHWDPHPVDALERYGVASDAPHRWRADGGWWIDPGDQCVPATAGVSRPVRRDDRHRRGHPDRAVVHPLEAGTT